MPTSYTTGTVSLANGSSNVTGVGTTWISNGVLPGDIFEAKGFTFEIATVPTNTSITLIKPWTDVTLSGNIYSIRFVPQATRVLTQVNTLLAQLANGILSGLSAIASPAADKLAYLTGASTWATIDFKTWARTFIAAADLAAGRTALGLGTIATQDATALSIGTLNLTGGQLKFPAAQAASADANTLDDYEEGSWTPDIRFGGLNTGITYGTNSARYTKVGRVVHVTGYIVLTSKGTATGAATLEGLPFASAGGTPGYAAGQISYYGGWSGLTSAPLFFISPAATLLTIRQFGSASVLSATDANFGNASSMMFSFVYTV